MVVTTAVLLVLLSAVIAWAWRDADQQELDDLIADTADPQVLAVSAGWFSHAGASEELAAYFPSQLLAHPGDTVRFTNPTQEDPHSVTFGVRGDRSNQPLFGTDDPLVAINGPCVSDEPLTATTTSCPSAAFPAGLPDFDGQAFYNSGIIPPGGGTFELRLADGLAPGSYEFFCVVHPAQVGSLDIVPSGRPTQRPSAVARSAAAGLARAMGELETLTRIADRGPIGLDANEVQAGVATPNASVNRFLPAVITIGAGDEVVWTNQGSVPHVAVFNGYLTPQEAIVIGPTALDGSLPREGVFTSGPIGPRPYPREHFALRFDRPGTYPYACTFHPGMAGTVIVT